MKFSTGIISASMLGSAILFAPSAASAQSAPDDTQAATNPASPEAAAIANTAESDKPKTTVELTPYVWGSAFSGDIQAGPAAPPTHVHAGLGTLIKHLDAAFFVSGLVEHNRLVVSADVTHAYLSTTVDFPTGNPLLPVVDARIKVSETNATGLVGYRVVKTERSAVDLMAGVRGWWMRPAVSIGAPISVTAKTKVSFADPIVAARARFNTSPKWSFLLYGDVGGFGASSDFTGQAYATANYRVGKNIWLSGGYRYQRINYDKDGIKVKTSLYGPLFGATFIF